MSARDRRDKKIRKLRKALRQTPPGFIDLIWLIRLSTRCTAGTARKVIDGGYVRVESHIIKDRFIPTEWRKNLSFEVPANG